MPLFLQPFEMLFQGVAASTGQADHVAHGYSATAVGFINDLGGQFWQRGGGYDRVVWSQEEWLRQLRSIEANPVRAGLVDPAEHATRSYRRTASHGLSYRIAEGHPEPALLEGLFAWAVVRVHAAESARRSVAEALAEDAPPSPWSRA